MDPNTFTTPNVPPTPQAPHSQWYKQPITYVVFGILLVVSIIAGLMLNKSIGANGSGKGGSAALTLYYRDGSTVLWQTGQQPGELTDFIAAIQQQLKTKYGPNFQSEGTWKVTTTLDNSLQTVAKDQIDAQKSKLTAANTQQTAFVAEDVTNGQVVSWVDNAIGGQKPTVRSKTLVGGLQLPFTYAAYLENTGLSTDTILNDVQAKLPGYACNNIQPPQKGGNCLFNYDFLYKGPIALKAALAQGRNVPAAQAAADIDAKYNTAGGTNVSATTRKMGADAKCYFDDKHSQETQCYISSAFGEALYATPLGLTEAYATLANGGARPEQTTILKVTKDGQTRQEWRNLKPTQAISKDIASQLTAAASDPSLSYLPKKDLFTTKKGTSLATLSGLTNDGSTTSGMQYSSKYAAGFWGMRPGATNKGTVAQDLLAVTHAWFEQAK